MAALMRADSDIIGDADRLKEQCLHDYESAKRDLEVFHRELVVLPAFPAVNEV